MMSIRALIVDDEPLARQTIREYLEAEDSVEILGECGNGKEALEAIEAMRPDLVFLDIQMPGLNGFEVLEQLVYMPQIVFSTANESFAVQAFETGAVDYLLKPYNRIRFDKALKRVLHRLEEPKSGSVEDLKALLQATRTPQTSTDQLFVRIRDRIVPVALEDIVWLEAAGDYTHIHLSTSSVLASQGIGNLEKRLAHVGFIRVHRSAIVATRAIKHLKSDGEGGYIATLQGSHSVRVSRSYAARVRDLIV